jgi:hypothetical protein
MKNVFYFILGVCLIILTSVTTASVMTVKPAKPKSVVIFSTSDGTYDIKDFIKKKSKLGYIVKSVAGTSQYGNSWIVVMEKY